MSEDEMVVFKREFDGAFKEFSSLNASARSFKKSIEEKEAEIVALKARLHDVKQRAEVAERNVQAVLDRRRYVMQDFEDADIPQNKRQQDQKQHSPLKKRPKLLHSSRGHSPQRELSPTRTVPDVDKSLERMKLRPVVPTPIKVPDPQQDVQQQSAVLIQESSDPAKSSAAKPTPQPRRHHRCEGRPIDCVMHCVICGDAAAGNKSCPGCGHHVHLHCGTPANPDAESFNMAVWCDMCPQK